MATAGAMSRFAVLAIDDLSDDDGKFETVSSGKKGKPPTLPENAQKKKTKKKKKKPVTAVESNEEAQSRQQHLDELQYEKDLEEALLLSKIASEEQKSIQPADMPLEPVETDRKKGKKKKKNRSQVVMSVEEFNQLGIKQPDQSEEVAAPPVVHTRLPEGVADEQFFSSISQESSKIVLKEKVHEDFKQQYRSGQAAATILQRKLDEKQEELQQQHERVQQLELELSEEKEKTAALQATLTSASMSKTASLVQMVKQLSQVKDELSTQLEENVRCLEQERTASRQLRAELDRLKGKR